MTDPEVEDLLRETFQSREGQAPSLSRVRPKPRRTPWIAAGVGTLVVLAGAIVAANAVRSPAPVTLSAPSASPTTAEENPPSGWRWESSLGVELQVPDFWTVDDYGCGMSDQPTVVRGEGGRPGYCALIGPPTKDAAFITRWSLCTDAEIARSMSAVNCPTSKGPLPPVPTEVALAEPSTSTAVLSVTVDGVTGWKHSVGYSNGFISTTLALPSREVMIRAESKDPALINRILASIRIVDADRLGCAVTTSWPDPVPKALPGKPALPDDATKLVLCVYSAYDEKLQSSTQVTGDAAVKLVRAVNAAREGANADEPKTRCLLSLNRKAPDLVLLAGGARVDVAFSGCTGRGITDGRHWSKLDNHLVEILMAPTHAGYAVSSDLK